MRKVNWKFLLLGILSFLLLFNSLYPSFALALDLEVTGNGEESSSEVVVTQATETTVVQENSADINNNVQINSNTGENDASENSGDVAINTGNSTTDLNIDNSANSSVAVAGCCDEDVGAAISGNGADSQNTITLNLTNSNYLSNYNNANITNSVTGSSNTGDNTANSNGGRVLIDTGNVKVNADIVNGPINSFYGKVYGGADHVLAKISGNGESSINRLVFASDSRNLSDVVNYANILNNIYWYANSGGNYANSNNGAVSIITGDVLVDILIKNGPINTSVVDIDCCEDEAPDDNDDPDDDEDEEDGDDEDEDNDDEDNNGGGDGDSNNGVGGAEQVASMVTGKILGLSNTSGNSTDALLFWLGAIILTLGVNFFGKTKLSGKYSK